MNTPAGKDWWVVVNDNCVDLLMTRFRNWTPGGPGKTREDAIREAVALVRRGRPYCVSCGLEDELRRLGYDLRDVFPLGW